MQENSGRLAVPEIPSDEDAEKRTHQRLPRTYPAEIARLAFPVVAEGVQVRCCDISLGGVCVEMDDASFALGDTCQVKVHIPLLNKYAPGFFKVYENDAEQYFTALAQVAWIKPFSGRFLMGFAFVNVHSDQSTALEKLIERAFAREQASGSEAPA